MKKVILEETFLISDRIKIFYADRAGAYRSVYPGLYKRLVLNDEQIVWVEFNDGKSDYGGHSNMNFIKDNYIIKELEKLYVATTREQQINSVIDK